MYGRTPLGQLVYDLGFTRLSDRYLAAKHHMPIASIRRMRERMRKHLPPPRRRKRK